jgi:hypothetical protein
MPNFARTGRLSVYIGKESREDGIIRRRSQDIVIGSRIAALLDPQIPEIRSIYGD